MSAATAPQRDSRRCVHCPTCRYLGSAKNSTGDELIDVLPQFPQLRFVNLWYAECPDALALRLQKALPNATVYHPAVAASEPERKSLRWLLDNKAVATGCVRARWERTFQDVPQGAFSVASVKLPESGPASGAANLRGLRCDRVPALAELEDGRCRGGTYRDA